MKIENILSNLHFWLIFVTNHDQIDFNYNLEKSKIEFEKIFQ